MKIELRNKYLSLSYKHRILDLVPRQFEEFQKRPMIHQPEPNRIGTPIGRPCPILPDRPTTSPIGEVKKEAFESMNEFNMDQPYTSRIGEIKEETLECVKKFVEDTLKARITLVNEHKVDQAEGELSEYSKKIIEEIYEA